MVYKIIIRDKDTIVEFTKSIIGIYIAVGLFIIGIFIFSTHSFSGRLNEDSYENFGPEWTTIIDEKKPVVLYFYSDNCGPCIALKPRIDELFEKYRLRYNFFYAKKEDEGNIKLIKKFGVPSLPAIFLFDPRSGNYIYLNRENYGDPDYITKSLDQFFIKRKE